MVRSVAVCPVWSMANDLSPCQVAEPATCSFAAMMVSLEQLSDVGISISGAVDKNPGCPHSERSSWTRGVPRRGDKTPKGDNPPWDNVTTTLRAKVLRIVLFVIVEVEDPDARRATGDGVPIADAVARAHGERHDREQENGADKNVDEHVNGHMTSLISRPFGGIPRNGWMRYEVEDAITCPKGDIPPMGMKSYVVGQAITPLGEYPPLGCYFFGLNLAL